MNIAVIGGGWAGAAAAHHLTQHGHRTTLYEASRHLGGRARRVSNTPFDYPTDNGQHILLGAYTATLGLMQELGINIKSAFHCIDLCINSLNQHYKLKAWPLPAPLHLAGALLNSKGFSLRDRYQLIRFQQQLKRQRWQVSKNQSVLNLLHHYQQSPTLIEHLWQPLCLAALNTPIDKACAQLFANVIRDSMGGARRDSQMLIPKQDMSALWVEAALSQTDVRLGQHIRNLTLSQDHVSVNNECFDACIVALPPYAAARLLQSIPTTDNEILSWIHSMTTVAYRPIATVYLEPAMPWLEPEALFMLHENRAKDEFGQWLFNHHAIPNSFAKSVLSVVISDAVSLNTLSREHVIASVEAQIRRQIGHRAPLAEIVKAELIIEKRATFEASPNTFRATENTPWPTLFLAGDWLQNDYPGVLEGAVRSGLNSAKLALALH